MQGIAIPTQNGLADRLTERFGLLLTQAQLAGLLGRRIGRRVYYPAIEVVCIISGADDA